MIILIFMAAVLSKLQWLLNMDLFCTQLVSPPLSDAITLSSQPNTTDPSPPSTARSGSAEDPTRPPLASPPAPDPAATVPAEDWQLVLSDLQVTDTGFYTCVAVSERRVLKAWTHLEVLEEGKCWSWVS